MRKLFYTVGVMFAALGLTLSISTVAQASADGPTTCYPSARSCVWFTHDGDVIHVQDGNADGHSAVAQVCSPGPSSCGYVANYLWNADGYESIATYSYGTQIPEGASVYYRACYGESGDHSIIACNSGWTHGTA